MMKLASPVDVYQFRVVIRGISPLIWRRLLLRSDATLAHFHDVLQTAFGWEDYHLHRFAIRGREYGIPRSGGPLYSDDARRIRLSDFHFRHLEKFVYEYDFGDLWIHDVRVEAILPFDPKKPYPCCIGGKRAGPPENCGGPLAYMEQLEDYRYIASGGDDREAFCNFEDEALEVLKGYDPEHFDRRRLNNELRRLAEAHLEGSDEIQDPVDQ